MAQRRRQSLKAQRKDKKRHSRNLKVKTTIKKTLKKLNSASQKKAEDTNKILSEAISQIAKAAKKGILHKNTAKRRISRLSKKISKLKA